MRNGSTVVPVVFFVMASSVSIPVWATTGTLTITTDTTLTEDHFGNIVIAADGVTLDCAGFNVVGTGTGTGISVSGRTGVTVKNGNVRGFTTFGFAVYNNGAGGGGFSIQESSFNTFTENTATNNGVFGFVAVFNSECNLLTVYSLSFLFLGGPVPVEPFGDCGRDPTEDGLDCASFPACR